MEHGHVVKSLEVIELITEFFQTFLISKNLLYDVND